MSDTGPPVSNCACPVWDRWDCEGIRYGKTRDQVLEMRSYGDEGCTCGCHDDYDEWNEQDEYDDRR